MSRTAFGTDRPSTLPRQLCQESEGHPTRRKVVRIWPRQPELRPIAKLGRHCACGFDARHEGPAATRTDPARRLSIHGVLSSMTVGPEARRAIVGALVGLLYGSVLALLSLFLFGGGGAHGTSIPLLLSSAPLGVFALVGKLVGEPYMGYGHNATVLGAPLVWAGLGWLVALSGQGTLKLSRILALLHYTSGLALIATAGEEPARLQRLLQYPEAVMWVTIYLAGQAALWSSMRASPEARQAIVGAMVGLLYGSVLIYLSIFATGGGHGTPVPFILSSAPLSVVVWSARYLAVASPLLDLTALLGMLFVWAGFGSF